MPIDKRQEKTYSLPFALFTLSTSGENMSKNTTLIKAINVPKNIQEYANAWLSAKLGKEKNEFLNYHDPEGNAFFFFWLVVIPIIAALVIRLSILDTLSSGESHSTLCSVATAICLFMVYAIIKNKRAMINNARKTSRVKHLPRLPEEEVIYQDRYHRMAHDVREEIRRLDPLIRELNTYTRRRYQLGIIETNDRMEALGPVIRQKRASLAHEVRRISELIVMQNEYEKTSTRKFEPVDLTEMRRRIEEIQVVTKASAATLQEMGKIDDSPPSVIEASAKLDAIQPELSRELPEATRLRLARATATKRAALKLS